MARRLAVFGLALLAAGCDKPPTREIEAAAAQVEAARQQGADKYAADRMKEAEQALATARQQAADENYRAAVASAAKAGERARSAVQAVGAARSLARGRAQVAVTEVKAVLDELDLIGQEAAAAKVPEEAFSELAPQAQEVRESLTRLEEGVEKDPLLAEASAAELKRRCSDLTTAYRQAQATWMAENRQRSRKRRR
jgi:hypothetical protein